MLPSGEDAMFGIGSKKKENWQDRVKQHRSGLRDVQVEKNEKAAAANKPRDREAAPARKGFGKRA